MKLLDRRPARDYVEQEGSEGRENQARRRLMTRSWLAASVLIGCLSVLGGSPPAETRPGAELRVAFTGLPEDTRGGVLLVCLIQLMDGTVTRIFREDPASEISIEAPERPLAIEATFLSESFEVLEGSAVVTWGEDAIEIAMASPDEASSPRRSNLPTYPPDEGMAIGYNPADFTATGPAAEPGLGPALAEAVVTGLVQAPCAEGEAPAYRVVESANPRGMALIEAEIKLQQRPEIDPRTRGTPHIIAATHLVKGTFSAGEDTFIAELYVEDLEGEVIAHARASSPADSWFEAVETAARSLADELCKK
jgi:hypothetical protein